jgi:hypothetical protein
VLGALAVVSMAVFALAVSLNYRFYTTYSGFYDSMSYLNHMAQVMSIARDEGFLEAVNYSRTGSTVFLPWLFSAAFGLFTDLSRVFGVVFQMPFLIIQLVFAYRYFRVVCFSPQLPALLFATILVSYPAVFFYNGGLGDFRMDLSQAFIYGAFLAQVAVARVKGRNGEWFLAGVLVATACLVRATTPVYVLIFMSVLFLVDCRRRGFGNFLVHYIVFGVTVVVISGWYFIGNYEYLHYYYVLWNSDANARLPFTQSVRHVLFLLSHIGLPLLISLLLVFLFQVRSFLIKKRQWRSVAINWVPLVGGLIPLGYLVFSGAGHNPFVSAVAVPGFLMFALAVFRPVSKVSTVNSSSRNVIILLLGLVLSVSLSLKNYESRIADWIPFKSGVEELVDESITHHLATSKSGPLRMTFLFLGSVDNETVKNHLIFEQGFRYQRNGILVGSDVAFLMYSPELSPDYMWIAEEKSSDQEVLDYVIKDSVANAGYAVVAETGSKLPDHHRINQYSESIIERLDAEPGFEKIAAGIEITNTLSVALYYMGGM